MSISSRGRSWLAIVICILSAVAVATCKLWPKTSSEVDKLPKSNGVAKNHGKSAAEVRHNSEFRKRQREIESQNLTEKDIPGPGMLDRLRIARNSTLRPKYNLFDENGSITFVALHELGLTDEEGAILQKATAELLTKAKSRISTNIIPDNIHTKPGVRAFTVKAFDFSSEMDDYSAQLVKQFEKEKTGNILLALPVDAFYGGFGLYDVQFSISEKDGKDESFGYPIQINAFDSKTGKSMGNTTTRSKFAGRIYPGVFDIDMNVID